MSFNRMPEITTLISKIDTAMARADGFGKDAIRNLMPELREAIDDVNAALREVDGLLFQGLRDEAIGLHDEDFAAAAARLNLEDREEWPELERFFVASGLSFPPKIDFDTLSALESAYSEIEAMRRPLDTLRRMALERAPVAERLRVLRELRKADPTKPVWTEAIKDHEQARVAELLPEVGRVLAQRDPQAVAALHAEITDPGWSVPIPRDLFRATRGADLWMNLRSAAAQAEEAGKGLESAWQQLQHAQPTPELVDLLRRLRLQYGQAVRLAAESKPQLSNCPTISNFVHEERLLEQIDAVASRLEQPLHWLAAQDAADAMASHFQQLCGQLEYLSGQKPARAAESAWLANLKAVQTEVDQICQSHAGLAVPPSLQERVASAEAAVLHRARQRKWFVLAALVAGIVAMGLMISGIAAWVSNARIAREDLQRLEGFSARAEAGEFAEAPADVSAIVTRHTNDQRFIPVTDALFGFIRQESDRREKFRQALEAFDRSNEAARSQLEDREQDRQLEAWPASVVDAARAWRRAREIGGEPDKEQTNPVTVTTDNAAVTELRTKEEEEIDIRERRQKDLESEYDKAGAEFVRRKNRDINEMLEEAADAETIDTLQETTASLLESLKSLDRERKKLAPELLKKTSMLRHPQELEELLGRTQRQLEARKQELEDLLQSGEGDDR